jgi:hypothetical protein
MYATFVLLIEGDESTARLYADKTAVFVENDPLGERNEFVLFIQNQKNQEQDSFNGYSIARLSDISPTFKRMIDAIPATEVVRSQ